MKPAGSVNGWLCNTCGRATVTVHVDAGVTPMMLGCRFDDCSGTARSMGYPPPPLPEHVAEAIAWEWRTATATELKRWRRTSPEMYQHCAAGGLVLAPLSDLGRQVLADTRANPLRTLPGYPTRQPMRGNPRGII